MKKKVICSVLLGLMVSGQLVGADYIKPKKDKKTGISKAIALIIAGFPFFYIQT